MNHPAFCLYHLLHLAWYCLSHPLDCPSAAVHSPSAAPGCRCCCPLCCRCASSPLMHHCFSEPLGCQCSPLPPANPQAHPLAALDHALHALVQILAGHQQYVCGAPQKSLSGRQLMQRAALLQEVVVTQLPAASQLPPAVRQLSQRRQSPWLPAGARRVGGSFRELPAAHLHLQHVRHSTHF